MDFSKWGEVIFQKDTFALVSKINSKFKYHINIFDKYFNVSLKFKDKTILEFTDTILETGKLNSFTRKVKNHEYIFIDGKLTLKKNSKTG